MAEKCIVCEEPAAYCIRRTSDFYCYDCAVENFSDIEGLEKLDIGNQQ